MVDIFRRHFHAADRSPVIILGLGRFGQALGEELLSLGVEVLAADASARRVQELSDDFEHIVCADTTQPATLRQLGVPDARRVVIAIGADLEASLLTASNVIDMGVPQVWAKADSIAHAKILRQIGCHHVIRPEAETGRRTAHLIGGGVQDFIEFDRDYAMAKIAVPESAAGKSPRAIQSEAHGVHIVAVRPAGGAFGPVKGDQPLDDGDMIIAAGPVAKLEKFADS